MPTPERPRAIRDACAGAVLGSLVAGAGWSWNYGLGFAGAAALVALHALLGIALGVAIGLVLRRRHGFALAAIAALALAGLEPAVASRLAHATPDAPTPHEITPVEVRDARAERLAIIGLDGGDWALLDPLLAAGELPHLAALLARGRGAVLRSIEPIASPVVWTTIFTGRPPSEHGIDSWTSSHTANRRTGTLWEMAGAAGLPSIVVNVPGTWPPTPIEGALVSGFPMPSPLRHTGDPRLAQSVATLVAEGDPSGPLVTVPAQRAADGTLHANASLGGWLAPTLRWRHGAIEGAIRRGWLPLPQVRIALARAGDGEPAAWTIAGEPIPLARGGWSPWLTANAPGGPLHLRIRRLDDGALFVTSAFQDPRTPVHPYASPPEIQEKIAELGMYVVEPTGWKTVADPRTRDALFEHLVDVEEMHLRASLALREQRSDWRLFAHVITLPDRISHAFWRFHRPEDYPQLPADEQSAHADKITRAYRESDRLLGRLLADLGEDTTVIVLSDHGFQSQAGDWGGHRLDGVLVAAGPGIAAGRERLALSVYDVVPLALALLGLPVAEDLASEPPEPLLAAGGPPHWRTTSYEKGVADAQRTKIEATTEEQLRGLGYID